MDPINSWLSKALDQRHRFRKKLVEARQTLVGLQEYYTRFGDASFSGKTIVDHLAEVVKTLDVENNHD